MALNSITKIIHEFEKLFKFGRFKENLDENDDLGDTIEGHEFEILFKFGRLKENLDENDDLGDKFEGRKSSNLKNLRVSWHYF